MTKTVAIIQARIRSKRLPRKIMRELGHNPLIKFLLSRLKFSNYINEIIVATGSDSSNDELVEFLTTEGIKYFRGDDDDVLSRYYNAAKAYSADVIIRVTGDCPFVDWSLIDSGVQKFNEFNLDYISNIDPPTYPDGLDFEIFTFSLLERAHLNADSKYDREHVTPYMRNIVGLKKSVILSEVDYSSIRITVDEVADLVVAENLVEFFYPRINFTLNEIVNLSKSRPELFHENRNINRNEGSLMGEGQKLWKRAKQIIPGGNMLLSKRPEMFLPGAWPTYYKKASGCIITDLDGCQLIDMSLMGVGTNILGYCHSEVDAAVLNAVSDGNMSTLNAPEEVYLAEKLIELHPWAEMVRFARTGGEANAIAIRIARASSGRQNVAICGYHGWHDWYLAANISGDSNLNGHLLPGLQPNGVPNSLAGSVHPFSYNNFKELENIVQNKDIGVIMMEVSRNFSPENNFLKEVRRLASSKNIVLIFDECTSGFRQSFGGLHKLYGVQPDMAVFGKALGNGYAITAVIGKRNIMESAQTSFISSTFWTERIGSVAALKTLEVMEREQSWKVITDIGGRVAKGIQGIADKYSVPIVISGLPALLNYEIIRPEKMMLKTFITQEMLKKGFLASNGFYACIAHTDELIERYFDALDSVFEKINYIKFENINEFLDGEVCHSGFRRLN